MLFFSIPYLYALVEFRYGRRNFYAAIARISKDDHFVYFHAHTKKKLLDRCIRITNENGNDTEFQVCYGGMFFLPNDRFSRVVQYCSKELINDCIEKYFSLPSLDELKDKREKLVKELKENPPNQKEIRKQIYHYSEMINERTALFLKENTNSQENSRYRNFRIVPNKQGISHVIQGGGCTPK